VSEGLRLPSLTRRAGNHALSTRKELPMLRLILAALAAAVAAFTPALAEPPKPVGLRAGAFAADVTPQSFPVSVNGGMADRQAKAATDPLHARCLVLDDGNTTLAPVVADSCMIPP